MSQRSNPLDIPEILFRVGLYIPLWVYDRSSTARDQHPQFTPQHLINCILVNRTWHDILLPILWFTFDDIAIPSSIRSVEILIRHGRHLRILELNCPSPDIIAIPARLLPHNLLLLDLATNSSYDWAKALVLQNTRLQSLRWIGGDFHKDDYRVLDASVLSKQLRQLQDLHLKCWKLDKTFMHLLRRNPGLNSLALEYVTGEFYPIQLGDQENQDDIHSNNNNNSSNKDDQKADRDQGDQGEDGTESEGVQLMHLTSLAVRKDVGSGPLEELVRLCPRLEELTWTGLTDSDLSHLTTNLGKWCPRLSALTYSTVEVLEDVSAYTALIQSIPHLAELRINIPALSDQFTEALIKHAPTLEILDLKILNQHEFSYANLKNLKRILTSCRHITVLSIEGSQCDADLFSFNWACLRLGQLFLEGLHSMARGEEAKVDNASVAARYGWTAAASMSEVGSSRRHISPVIGTGEMEMENGTTEAELARNVSTGFLKRLLSHLQAMIHLQSFVLNGVEYTRGPIVQTVER
ncbi:hypothetical protein B0O80DRAFT_295238 [Mortierella sp. GBAus27b]|nr:hypothetical protein BGX31_009868 [Mortierella sp. GBA43]KAI8357744.1 hypothetical protein B0O80DRAFT_295238 [Mortierella sp. GBAus27b]